MIDQRYRRMWEEFALRKGAGYLKEKFDPAHGVGLKNYLRERALLRLLAPAPEDVLLDVGCASGRQVSLAARVCRLAVGIDIAVPFIRAAQAQQVDGDGRTAFCVATAEHLPFEDNAFAKVLCAEVLEHVFDPRHILREIRRVLRPGGSLVISVPNLNGEGTWWGRTVRAVTRRRFEPIASFSLSELERHGDAHVREYDPRAIAPLLEQEGFSVRRVRGVAFIDFPKAERIMNRLNRPALMREALVRLEEAIGASNRTARWGRHLVVMSTCRKP